MGRRTSRARGRAVDLTRYQEVIPDWQRFLDTASRPEPTVFRIRTGRIPEAELVDGLRRQGFALRPLDGLPSYYQVEDGPFPVTMTFEHWHGLIYVQQASTGVAAPALGAKPGERVLDLCSAPGGKTTHLAEMMEDRGCLVACEIDERRIRGLLGNVYRLGHPNILVVAGDGRVFPEEALFDRVLVDAPCSGEGTLRRRAGKAPNQSASFLGYVTSTQRSLLEKAVRLTRPGGTILYVTCTFAPEENEAVVSAVLAQGEVELEPLALPVPHAPGLTAFADQRFDPRMVGAARIYPHHFDSGGLFLARLRRLGEPAASDGWSEVPPTFPGEAGDGDAPAQIALALEVLAERYGIIGSSHPDWGWTVRGGRAWVHTCGEWPATDWRDGACRVVSIGQRAVEFDTKGRPRPTNDFLRIAGSEITGGVAELSTKELEALLRRESVPSDIETRGPTALRHGGHVIGRGAVTSRGLVSEIPKARASDLSRVLAARSP